jgi:hypothetical protein
MLFTSPLMSPARSHTSPSSTACTLQDSRTSDELANKYARETAAQHDSFWLLDQAITSQLRDSNGHHAVQGDSSQVSAWLCRCGWLLSRGGRSLPANASGCDTHRESIAAAHLLRRRKCGETAEAEASTALTSLLW